MDARKTDENAQARESAARIHPAFFAGCTIAHFYSHSRKDREGGGGGGGMGI